MTDIITLAQAEHVNLNETLAERIAQQCLADPRVEGVRVRIAKPEVWNTASRWASRSSGAGRRPPSTSTRNRMLCHTAAMDRSN